MSRKATIGWFFIAVYITLSFLVFNLKAQERVILSGAVLDEQTHQPLSFASISIQHKPHGTVTNVEGEFDFHVPVESVYDTVIVSYIGYKSFTASVQQLVNVERILLSAAAQWLKTVEIEAKKITGRDVVALAVRNLRNNYSQEPYCLEGFFREIEEENGKYVLLTEAAIELYDKNFDGRPRKLPQESVNIREMRRSIRYSKLYAKDNIGHALVDLIENNDVRYNRGMLDTTRNTFAIERITEYNGRQVYQVSMTNRTDRGTLYIDTDTYGFLKIEMDCRSRNAQEKYYAVNVRDSVKRGRVWFRFSIEFEVYNNKLYPRRMHESELNEIVHAKTGELKMTAVETLEFIITHVHTNKYDTKAKRLRYGMELKGGPYHPDFWKNYNILKLTPLNEKLIRDLEQDVSLQEQFNRSKS